MAACPRSVNPRDDPLPDHLPLKLGHCGEHADDELALTRGDVEGGASAVENAQPNVTRQEVLHQFQQVKRGACQSIKLPGHEGIPRMEGLQALSQPRTGLLRTTGDIGVEIACLDAGGKQRVVLEVKLLIFGRDSQVADEHPVLSTQAGIWYPAWCFPIVDPGAGPTSHSGPARPSPMVSNPVYCTKHDAHIV